MHSPLRRVLFLATLGVFGAAFFRLFVLEAIYIASESMSPTLFVGTKYLVNKWIYHVREPKRGEIILFRHPLDPAIGEVKRVIAVPGDTIELREKKVVLNGNPLEEPYTVYKRAKEKLAGDTLGPVTVPPKSVFVLGDNRDVSEDSSYWHDPATGQPIYFVSYGSIKGKLIEVP
jgi:signal peptidase I